MARISIVTAGHLSTSPRMLKAADALAACGHRVRVVSTRHVEWATRADEDARRSRRDAWEWSVVDYDRGTARATRVRTGLRLYAARAIARGLGPARCPLPVAVRGYSRVHDELLSVALARPADLYYGGSTGALAAVAAAGRRSGVPYALDLEDFHSGEQEDGRSRNLIDGLAERIERAVLPRAAFLTAGSAAIAAAYAEKYGVEPIAVHNTFPLPAGAPAPEPRGGEGLRLYWFSQTIGPRRGLEDAVRAMGRANIAGAIHLRGRAIPSYLEQLCRLAAKVAPGVDLVAHEPAPPDAMVDLCRGYDVGVSLEQGHVLNRALCLTNKAFTYMLAGLAVALTRTPGQESLAADLGGEALVYEPGDVDALAAGLKRWADDRCALARARAASWRAAERRWHWEHPAERGALLRAVAAVVR